MVMEGGGALCVIKPSGSHSASTSFADSLCIVLAALGSLITFSSVLIVSAGIGFGISCVSEGNIARLIGGFNGSISSRGAPIVLMPSVTSICPTSTVCATASSAPDSIATSGATTSGCVHGSIFNSVDDSRTSFGCSSSEDFIPALEASALATIESDSEARPICGTCRSIGSKVTATQIPDSICGATSSPSTSRWHALSLNSVIPISANDEVDFAVADAFSKCFSSSPAASWGNASFSLRSVFMRVCLALGVGILSLLCPALETVRLLFGLELVPRKGG
mmetsp:Transcript_71497/g.113286  ORF Transcript_71497/g.113286 Transcript_71497/m.113286 type:complete len:279 (-) Transcript_71497:63-899(-)